MLTTDEMQQILIEATLEIEPSDTRPEALEFRENLEREIEQAKQAGQTIEIPPEYPS